MQRTFYGLFEADEKRSDYVFDTIKEAERQKGLYEKHGHGPFRVQEVSQSGRLLDKQPTAKIKEGVREIVKAAVNGDADHAQAVHWLTDETGMDPARAEALISTVLEENTKTKRSRIRELDSGVKGWFLKNKAEFLELYLKDDDYQIFDDIAGRLISKGVPTEEAEDLADEFAAEIVNEAEDLGGFSEDDFDRPMDDDSLFESKKIREFTSYPPEDPILEEMEQVLFNFAHQIKEIDASAFDSDIDEEGKRVDVVGNLVLTEEGDENGDRDFIPSLTFMMQVSEDHEGEYEFYVDLENTAGDASQGLWDTYPLLSPNPVAMFLKEPKEALKYTDTVNQRLEHFAKELGYWGGLEESTKKPGKRVREMICTSHEDSRSFNEKYPNCIGNTDDMIPDFVKKLAFREAKKVIEKAGYKIESLKEGWHQEKQSYEVWEKEKADEYDSGLGDHGDNLGMSPRKAGYHLVADKLNYIMAEDLLDRAIVNGIISVIYDRSRKDSLNRWVSF
jgi:hypothetical protein